MNFAKTGQFKTGRIYDIPQVISYAIKEIRMLELEMCLVNLQFTDKARHITGNMAIFLSIDSTVLELQAHILRNYDSGSYDLH